MIDFKKFSLNCLKKSEKTHTCSSFAIHFERYENAAEAGPDLNTTVTSIINKIIN